MKVSLNWLKQWVDTSVPLNELASQLTMAGLEVDKLLPASTANLDHVHIGKVLEVNAHPDADKLRVCRVQIDNDREIPVVTNVASVKADTCYAIACAGAHVDGLDIKPTKLRGVESNGMFCSANTLGLTDADEGLFELPVDAPVGALVRDFLQLNDDIIELEITPNRGDCLSIAGVAREVGVLQQTPVTVPAMEEVQPTCDDTFEVRIEDEEACPRYVGRVINNVDLQKRAPIWMQECLRRAGIRSINAAVDITNYVMLELGQPMHAFDLDELKGAITVRRARKGERLTLLNEAEVELEESLLIADEKGPLAIAGVMGGEHSGVSDATTNIFLESAFFEPVNVANSARRYALSTDSSFRFERGVDFTLQRTAIERATALVLSIMGGTPGPVTEQVNDAHLPTKSAVLLRASRIERLLGFAVEAASITDCLTRLGFECTAQGDDQWLVNIPAHRFDCTLEVDLIEEVARVYGYDNVPLTRPASSLQTVLPSETALRDEVLQQACIARGYHEVITYSFVDSELQSLINPNSPSVELLNPISSDMNVMRTSLWPGLITTLMHNRHRQMNDLKLFEMGRRYVIEDGHTAIQAQQVRVVAGLWAGQSTLAHWNGDARDVDFYDVKGDIERMFTTLGISQKPTFTVSSHPGLHPGQQAEIVMGESVVGIVGALHPRCLAHFKTKGPIFVFELCIDELLQVNLPMMTPISKFPSVKRDLSFVVDEAIQAGQIEAIIRVKSGDLLHDLHFFDVYVGQGIEKGQKNLGLTLIFQHSSHTLIEDEINSLVNDIVSECEQQLHAKLRDW